jgi:hypothetical protein
VVRGSAARRPNSPRECETCASTLSATRSGKLALTIETGTAGGAAARLWIPSEPQCRGRSSFTVVSGIRQDPSDRRPVCYQACRAAARATSGVLPYRIRSMWELSVSASMSV